MRFQELVDWSLVDESDGEPAIVLVVDDGGDDALAAVLRGGDAAAGRGFSGSWRAGAKDDTPIISFLLLEDEEPGLERAWWTARLDPALLAAAVRVPHHVHLVPRAAAGGGEGMPAGLRVGVDHASARVAELLADHPG
jgi:hypothetical protein